MKDQIAHDWRHQHVDREFATSSTGQNLPRRAHRHLLMGIKPTLLSLFRISSRSTVPRPRASIVSSLLASSSIHLKGIKLMRHQFKVFSSLVLLCSCSCSFIPSYHMFELIFIVKAVTRDYI